MKFLLSYRILLIVLFFLFGAGVFVSHATAACNIHLACPGGAVAVACQKDSCGKSCGECNVTCTGDCSDPGTTAASKGVIPGGDNGGGGGGGTDPCQLNPNAGPCAGGNNPGGGGQNPGGGGNQGPGGNGGNLCDRFPGLPRCNGGPPDKGGCTGNCNGGPNTTVNNEPKKNIKGTVWYDWNQNKNKNPGEPGVKDMRVESNPGNGNANTDGQGDYEIKNQDQNKYTVRVEKKEWNVVFPNNPDTHEANLNQGNANDVNFGLFKGYRLGVFVYADINRNDSHSLGEPPIRWINVDASHTDFPGTINDNGDTNAQGNVSFFPERPADNKFNGLPGGGSQYDISSQGFSNGFVTNRQNPFRVTINNVDNQDPPGESLGLIPQWQIGGYVFLDLNRNGIRDNGEENITGVAPNVTVRGLQQTNNMINAGPGGDLYNNLVRNVNGTFNGRRMMPGRYQATYIPQPDFTVTPASYTFMVGDGAAPFWGALCADTAVIPYRSGVTHCIATANSQGRPVQGNVTNLAFAVEPPKPWIRSWGLDMRFNNGFINNIPSSACGGAYASLPSYGISPLIPSVLTPGIILSGAASDEGMDFVPGRASPPQWNWTVRNTYSPQQAEDLHTSFKEISEKLLAAGVAGAPLVGTAGCSSNNACSPSSSLPSDIYIVPDDLTITGWNIPAGRNIVLLVKGNLYINGEISVAQGSSSFTVIVDKSIIVDASVGEEVPDVCTPPPGGGNPLPDTWIGDPLCAMFPGSADCTTIDGFLSADEDVIVETTNNPQTEKILNITGAVVVNAELNPDSGEFINERDLGLGNVLFPAVNVKARPDMLLNLPEALKLQKLEYRELAP